VTFAVPNVSGGAQRGPERCFACPVPFPARRLPLRSRLHHATPPPFPQSSFRFALPSPEYKGLQYTAADLSKMTRSEREYRMQLMAMSKEEVKMEMPGGELINGALNLYKVCVPPRARCAWHV